MATLENNNQQEDISSTDNDRTQDAGNADAAKFNADEQERFVNERMDSESADAGESDEHATVAADQGSKTELEERLAGGTNLSLDQLKKERNPQGGV
jgi:hypothetical protein